MRRKWEAFILLKRVIFQDAFCCLCHARMWVDLFLQFCTREPASHLQIALIIRHIVHWWIMCGPQSRYTAFKIAHLSCKPDSQRSWPLQKCCPGAGFFASVFSSFWGHCFRPLVHHVSLTGWGLENRQMQAQFLEKTWGGQKIFSSLLRK